MNENLPICSTIDECLAHDGERIQVVAIYTVWDPLPERARNHPPARQVQLMFGEHEEAGVFLGAWGYQEHHRPLDEIACYSGRKVCVKGKFLKAMPPHPTDPPEATALSGACIHPVESIALSE